MNKIKILIMIGLLFTSNVYSYFLRLKSELEEGVWVVAKILNITKESQYTELAEEKVWVSGRGIKESLIDFQLPKDVNLKRLHCLVTADGEESKIPSVIKPLKLEPTTIAIAIKIEKEETYKGKGIKPCVTIEKFDTLEDAESWLS